MNRTVADRCIHEFDLIPRDENYFCVPNRLDNFLRRWAGRAEVSEANPKSLDSTICLRFEDGSRLNVCNPGQTCYYAFVLKA